MHKLLALVTVAILASSGIAADGGINEATDLNDTDFESMEYSNVVYEEQEFTISLTLKNESTNISQINWITQVCINSGVCYPPKTIEMNTSDDKTWTASVVVDEDASYLNWRIDQIDDNDTEESLIQKIHQKEHEILPKAIQLISEDRCVLDGRRVFIKS